MGEKGRKNPKNEKNANNSVTVACRVLLGFLKDRTNFARSNELFAVTLRQFLQILRLIIWAKKCHF